MSKYRLKSEQNTRRGLKGPVTREPVLWRHFKKEPVPPDPLAVPDAEIDLGKFVHWSGLEQVVPFVTQHVMGIQRMIEGKNGRISKTVHVVGPDPIVGGAKEKIVRKRSLKVKRGLLLIAVVVCSQDCLLNEPKTPLIVERELHPESGTKYHFGSPFVPLDASAHDKVHPIGLLKELRN